jgi:cellulose synthase (UDP-forming)
VFLVYGNLIYQIARSGYFKRLQHHKQKDKDTLLKLFDLDAPSLKILIPSYKEELDVVERSLLSSALQEYSKKEIVLLIDNPPSPKSEIDRQILAETRALPSKIEQLLNAEKQVIQKGFDTYQKRMRESGGLNYFGEVLYLGHTYQQVSEWFWKLAERYLIEDHTDQLFVDTFLRRQAKRFESISRELFSGVFEGKHQLKNRDFSFRYQSLIAMFSVRLTSFERKCYDNLSHEPNKAMNLKSRICSKWRSLKLLTARCPALHRLLSELPVRRPICSI